MIELIVGLVLLGGLVVLAPRFVLGVLALIVKLCGVMLVGSILLAFGWLGTGHDQDALDW